MLATASIEISSAFWDSVSATSSENTPFLPSDSHLARAMSRLAFIIACLRSSIACSSLSLVSSICASSFAVPSSIMSMSTCLTSNAYLFSSSAILARSSDSRSAAFIIAFCSMLGSLPPLDFPSAPREKPIVFASCSVSPICSLSLCACFLLPESTRVEYVEYSSVSLLYSSLILLT